MVRITANTHEVPRAAAPSSIPHFLPLSALFYLAGGKARLDTRIIEGVGDLQQLRMKNMHLHNAYLCQVLF